MVDLTEEQWCYIVTQTAMAKGEDVFTVPLSSPMMGLSCLDQVLQGCFINFADRCLLTSYRLMIWKWLNPTGKDRAFYRETARLMAMPVKAVTEYVCIGSHLNHHAISLLRRTYVLNEEDDIRALSRMTVASQMRWAHLVAFTNSAELALAIASFVKEERP